MSTRKTWLLLGLLVLALAACAGLPSSSRTNPQALQVTEAAASAVKDNAGSFWLESREGTAVVELQPINLAEPALVPEGKWIFRVSLTESRMDAPSLTGVYDLTRLAYLAGPNGEQVSPASWKVEEEGHMGHHVKGTLTFPGEAQVQTIRVVIREVGGVSERVFEWQVAP